MPLFDFSDAAVGEEGRAADAGSTEARAGATEAGRADADTNGGRAVGRTDVVAAGGTDAVLAVVEAIELPACAESRSGVARAPAAGFAVVGGGAGVIAAGATEGRTGFGGG